MMNTKYNHFSPLFIDTCEPNRWNPPQNITMTPQSWSSDCTSESDLQNSGHSSPSNQYSVTNATVYNPLFPPFRSNKSRYEIILEAPSATSLEIMGDDSSLTYLNKGQYYTVRLQDEEKYDGDIMSTIILTFSEEPHVLEAVEFWQFWLNQQERSYDIKATEIALDRSSGIRIVEPIQFDRITFIWNGRQGANIAIKFNCLSTDFSRIKGVRGIPLCLHVDTALNSDMVHSVSCRIKLFRDKGAERKNKDDFKHIKKYLERILQKEQQQQQPYMRRESEKILNYLRKQRHKYTQLSDDHILPLELSPAVTTAAMNMSLQSPVATAEEEEKELTEERNYALKRRRSSSYYTPTSPMYSHITDQMVLPKRMKLTKLCIFVRFGTCTTYRAVYLKELNLESFVSQISEFLSLNQVAIKEVLWLVANKNNLVVTVDDSVIESIPENQDMEISTNVSSSGEISLYLRY